jgi:hypothetical protein
MENVANNTYLKPVAPSTRIDKDRAKKVASYFIFENLSASFCAGLPRLIVFPVRTVWSVPIVLVYPLLGTIGEVGAIIVDAEIGTVAGWTPIEEVYLAARELCEMQKVEICPIPN